MADSPEDSQASRKTDQTEEPHAEELRRTNQALVPAQAVSSADGSSAGRDTLEAERRASSDPKIPAGSTAKEVTRPARRAQQWLSPDEIVAALAINSPALAEALFVQAKGMMAAEDARDTSLGAKAAALLGAGGLSLTVAFTFGGFLLEHPDLVAPSLRAPVLWLYCSALLSGLGSALLALLSFFVTERYQGIEERVVLDEGMLRQADNFEEPAAYHYRYQTAHVWQVYQANARANHTRATTVRNGQVLFLIFLVVLMAIGIVMTYSAQARIPAPITPPATTLPTAPPAAKERTDRQEPEPPVVRVEPSEETIMPTAERPPPQPTPAPGPGRPIRGDPQPPRPPPPPTPVPGPGRERPPG